MDLNNLRLFVAIVQTGSLSAASEKLGVPIATISRRLGELEQALNTQLLDRSKKGAKPTMAGQQLYEQVYLSIDQLAQAENLFQSARLSGVLRISTFSGFNPLWDKIALFQARYPDVQVHCQITDRVVDLIEDGIDIAVRAGELHTDSVIAKKFGNIGNKIIAHPNLLAKVGTPQHPKDLANLPCAAWAKNGQREHHWQFAEQAVKIQPILASNDSHALAHFAKKGQAFVMLSDYFADQLIAEHGLAEVLTDFAKPAYPVHLLYLSQRHPSSLVQAFLAVCE
ncbi:LysR family transcriptional regulator [Moraxella cuniculi]|uniref:D-malate degradation protein R n=1 Tax=Moraxella cuniculi TaxID=34061 RepID=A0A3S4SCV8_9GAMM|nr:LysR family transcriptional regulator [Moraxella cuniculi]VEG13328.1 D-malate degradation protein R [Moraxella cuniculi]